MKVNAGKEYSFKLDKFGKDAPEIAKKVVMAGAAPIADEIRKGLVENLQDPEYVGLGDGGLFGGKQNTPTGDLLDSFGIAPPGPDKNGNTNTKIGFEGYDSKGTPNALKARAMESGTSSLRKRPFVRPAVNKMKGKAIDAMGKKLDDEMKIYSL
jgi:HK97 gp10 family phage protein